MQQLLTKTEAQILKLISAGISSKSIAEECEVSVRTIEKHRSNIIRKMQLPKDANSLTRWAMLSANKIAETI